MPFPTKHVANCFLQRDFEDSCATLTPMKLQKLVYFMHGWHLAIMDEGAIDGQFEAWPYGPVEEDLYHIFKSFRNQPINSYATSWEGDQQTAYVVSRVDNPRFYEILDFVANKYMHYTAAQLSAMTHMADTPWSVTREQNRAVISDDLIKNHFRTLARQ